MGKAPGEYHTRRQLSKTPAPALGPRQPSTTLPSAQCPPTAVNHMRSSAGRTIRCPPLLCSTPFLVLLFLQIAYGQAACTGLIPVGGMQAGCKGNTGTASPGGAFGQTSGGLFGQTQASAPFGQASTPAFGAASTPAFGAASTPSLFGASSAPAQSGFGFGSTPAFGSTSTPAFGASSTPAFGQVRLH